MNVKCNRAKSGWTALVSVNETFGCSWDFAFYTTPRIYNTSLGLSYVYNALDSLVKNHSHSQLRDFRWNIYNFLPMIQLCIVLRLSQGMFFFSTQPHSHTHCIQPDRRNYCTNFIDSKCHKNKPWCYTMNPKKQWAYCDIPKCREYIVDNKLLFLLPNLAGSKR